MEKTLEVHLQELREEIAQEIQAIHPDMTWTYDADVVLLMEQIIAIVRGEKND